MDAANRKRGESYGWCGRNAFKSRAAAEARAYGCPVIETAPGKFRISCHHLFWIDGRWIDMSEGA